MCVRVIRGLGRGYGAADRFLRQVARKAIGSPLSGPCHRWARGNLKHVQTAQNRIYDALKHGAIWMKAGTSYDTLW